MKVWVGISMADGSLRAAPTQKLLYEELSSGYWITQERDFGKANAEAFCLALTDAWKWESVCEKTLFIHMGGGTATLLDHPEVD